MSEIKWLEVVLEYAKRFPDVTFGELFGIEYGKGIKLSELHLKTTFTYYYLDTIYGSSFFSTSKCKGKGELEYNYGGEYSKVSNHVLLRLLTEGLEDKV